MYARKNIKVCKFLITSTNVIAIIRLTSKATVDVLFSVKYEYHSLGFTAKRMLERLVIQISSLFVIIWQVCIRNFKGNFLFSRCLYGLAFYLEAIGVPLIMIWWPAFEKKPFHFWPEIWIQVVVILLQLYMHLEI